MKDPDRQRPLGHRSYTRLSLLFYDAGVLGFNNRFVWRCPTSRLLRMYQEGISNNHLDVGVGTGYFLDRVCFPSPRPRLGLLDRSPGSLAHAAQRLGRYRPETYAADVLEPRATPIEPFDSIGMNYLVHCLPGPIEAKAAAFSNLAGLLRPNGVLFGSTVLPTGVAVSAPARAELALWNRLGVFDNRKDTLDGLRAILASRFAEHEIEVRCCVALFRARKAAG
jgi:SAM-dependent methyltransferase